MARPASLPALRAAVRSAPARSERMQALEQVIEESSRHPTRFLSEVALDGAVDLDVRLRAVAALGDSATDSAVAALVAALDESSQPVVRRAAERLGTLPGTEQLEALKRVRTGNAATREAVRWAKVFVSYRNGLGEYRVEPGGTRLEPDASESVSVEVTAPPRALAAELEGLVGAPVFGVRLTHRGAVSFACRGRDRVCLLAREVAEGGAPAMADGQAMPAVVMQRSPESGDLVTSHVVLADPERNGSIRLHVATPAGAVVMSGTGTVDEGLLSFELASTGTPHLAPTSVRGTLDSGRLVVEQFVTSERLAPSQRRLVRSPVPLTAPEA